jgi:hypothetical protein
MLSTLIIFFITTAFSFGFASDQTKSGNTENVTIPLGERISLSMNITAFEASTHKITKCKILDWEGICLIDGKPVFGTDWDLPKNQLSRALLRIDGNYIDLDVSCMFNPWFGKPKSDVFSIEKVEGGYVLKGSFSDGAGSYEAEWLVIQNTSVRTKIARLEY